MHTRQYAHHSALIQRKEVDSRVITSGSFKRRSSSRSSRIELLRTVKSRVCNYLFLIESI